MTRKPRLEKSTTDTQPLTRDSLLTRLGRARDELSAIIKSARRTTGIGESTTQTLDAVRRSIGSLKTIADLQTKLTAFESELLELLERDFQELDTTIRYACSQRGWKVEGHWPTLYIDRGVTVEIDIQRRSATVGNRQVATAEASAIISILESEVGQLLPRNFDPAGFMRDLTASYDKAKRQSTQVPIFDVYQAYLIEIQTTRFWRDASNAAFISVSADQFRARFSRMLECGILEAPDGRILHLLPPLNPKDGLFLYLPSESRFGYVGRVEFHSPSILGAS